MTPLAFQPTKSEMANETLSVKFSDIAAAARTLADVAHRTPVFTSRDADKDTGAQLFFKCENFQHGGAFKFRGAYNAISRLSEKRKRCGVVAYSSGNHAQGVALASRLLGVRATVVMPNNTPDTKLAAARAFGAEVVLYAPECDDREAIAARLAEKIGAVLIPPSDHPHVIAGQGTVIKELIEAVGRLDYVIAPVGGGGLLAGSAIAAMHLSPGCSVIGVEPEAANDAQQSLSAGTIVHIATPKTIADGARNRHIGSLVLPLLQAYVNKIITVSDDQLMVQMRFFAERMKMVVEPTGCLAAAAALNHVVDLSGARVGVIVSGGNVDAEMLGCSLIDSKPRQIWSVR
ncbi:MAG: threo-3-hydroxy-L-aspartate ammonia-lyase [Methylocella sp.]